MTPRAVTVLGMILSLFFEISHQNFSPINSYSPTDTQVGSPRKEGRSNEQLASKSSLKASLLHSIVNFDRKFGNKIVRSDEGELYARVFVPLEERGRRHPDTLYGIFFEEINYAGSGGLSAELINNRGFEAGGQQTPSNIYPWIPLGDESQVWLESEKSSCFENSPIALRMNVYCKKTEDDGTKIGCSDGLGVGVSNPGYWGMNIERDAKYQVSLWLRALSAVDLFLSFLSSDGQEILASEKISVTSSQAAKWHKRMVTLTASSTDRAGQLAVTTRQNCTVWIDQLSAVPLDTWKGHGLRKDLAEFVARLNPGFLRFPGGCYVEGNRLANAFRWRESVGERDNRHGHYNGVWGYWSDDSLGFYEYLQFAEDLNATPIWVFNNGISHIDRVNPKLLGPFVKDVLAGLEFARGSPSSCWGKERGRMGHVAPFNLSHVAVGNEDCGSPFYRESFLRFYAAVKEVYPDVQVVSNCDATWQPLDHPADLYDFHIYTDVTTMAAYSHTFDDKERTGPKALVSEYAVWGEEGGSLMAALAEASFALGMERNSDVVMGGSYAPLLSRNSHSQWQPNMVVFDSWHLYGTPSYWVARMLGETRAATWQPSTMTPVKVNVSADVALTTSVYFCPLEESEFLVLKAVNMGLFPRVIELTAAEYTGEMPTTISVQTLTGRRPDDSNSFAEPTKVTPVMGTQEIDSATFNVTLPPISFSVFRLKLGQGGSWFVA